MRTNLTICYSAKLSLLITLLLGIDAIVGWTQSALAQEPNRAGLVVVHGDGTTVTRCIDFAEESINGYDLLQRSGFALSIEASGLGVAVCSIDNEGCSFPQQACFCETFGLTYTYWSYWTQENEQWLYSSIGATETNVQKGDVQAWLWGEGTVDSATPPPYVPFDQICVPPTEMPTPLPPTLTPSPSWTPSPTWTFTPLPSDTPTEIPTFTPTHTPTNTFTPLPTATETPTLTPTETPTPVPTVTPLPTNTSIPTVMPTEILTIVPSPTETLLPTNAPLLTLAPTLVPPTATTIPAIATVAPPTATAAVADTNTPLPSETPFPTAMPTPTPTPTVTPTPEPSAPLIRSFWAERDNVKAGESVLLRWDVEGADSLSLLTADEEFTLADETQVLVQPSKPTHYILIAKNHIGESAATVTISVGAESAGQTSLDEDDTLIGESGLNGVAWVTIIGGLLLVVGIPWVVIAIIAFVWFARSIE